jgi:APA family basic amino acid/polyamine antiporter
MQWLTAALMTPLEDRTGQIVTQGESCSGPVRAIGLISLIAIAVNGVIGAGIFALPATVAKILGPASPFAFLIAGLSVILISLCFAEAGATFEITGGPYVYAREAFGGLIGFEVGWIFLVARITAMAAIANVMVSYMGYFFLISGTLRASIITLTIALLAVINFRGVRYGVRVGNLATIAKLLPLLIFVFAGLFAANISMSSLLTIPSDVTSLQRAGLILIFAFGGFEFSAVPSEEVVEPKRNVSTSLITAVLFTVTIYVLVDLITLGTLPDLASDETPLSSAASRFMGPIGATLLTLGAIMSTAGTSAAIMLVGPRMLYALAKGELLPHAFARLHPRHRTPHMSIILFAASAWALAISGSFVQLATANAIARLLYYATTCLAVPVLRRKRPNTERRFVVPGGPLIPLLAVALCVWLLAAVSMKEAAIALAVLILGAALYLSYGRLKGGRRASN